MHGSVRWAGRRTAAEINVAQVLAGDTDTGVNVARVPAKPTNAEVSVAQVLATPTDAEVNVTQVLARRRGQCCNNPTNPYYQLCLEGQGDLTSLLVSPQVIEAPLFSHS